MNIGLFAPDSKIPNLAIMKISTYHKSKGDNVGFLKEISNPDIIYTSVIFTKNKYNYYGLKHFYPKAKIIYGGSGINYDCLPNNIEHIMPDYDLYDIDYSLGFITRGCIRKCDFCIVHHKEGNLCFNAPLKEFVNPEFKKLILLDNNLLAYKNHLDILKEIKERGLKVDFNQGLDIRLVNKDNSKLLSELKYYNQKFVKKTLRFAFDNSDMKKQLLRGFNLLIKNGIKPRDIMFYILAYPDKIQDAVHRVNIIKELGSRPFIMRINQAKSRELIKLSRWVNHLPYYEIFTYDEFRG